MAGLRLESNTPEFSNSAGRLLALLGSLAPGADYFVNIATLYGGNSGTSEEAKVRIYLDYMSMTIEVFDELMQDIENSPVINQETKCMLTTGLGSLGSLIFNIVPSNPPRGLQETERVYLRMAGSMLEKEEQLGSEEIDGILEAIDLLMNRLDDANIHQSAKEALMELARHARFAVDHYRIYGLKGFRSACKKMLGELLVILAEEGNDVKQQAWWQNAVELVKKFDAIASRLVKYKPLLEAGGRLLLGGS